MDPELIEKLRKFKGISKLKKAALNIMVREKFIRQNSESDSTPKTPELVRMKSGGETLLNDEIDNLRT